MTTMILCKCENCNKEFERNLGEINRNKKLGRKNYCSRKCGSKNNIKNIPENLRMTFDISTQCNNLFDKFSKFRWHLRNAKSRSSNCELTLNDLENQWDKQNGLCPYTGWKLKNMRTMKDKLPRTPDRASLDRIDSSKGYTKDNIQFVSLMAQYAKNNFQPHDVYSFCEAVVKNKA